MPHYFLINMNHLIIRMSSSFERQWTICSATKLPATTSHHSIAIQLSYMHQSSTFNPLHFY
uniref:Uncharacterized protein n=1 Tax=Anguilla anguilla TaxID=7936 RepID=A0A0E9XFL2_ANGAN